MNKRKQIVTNIKNGMAVKGNGSEVVKLMRNGTVILDSGGRRTKKVMDRINWGITPMHMKLFSERGVWKVTNFIVKETYEFYDGMIFRGSDPYDLLSGRKN